MADEVDLIDNHVEIERERAIGSASAFVESMPTGVPGECRECGEHSPRLVGGLCAPCRDDIAHRQRRIL